MDIKKYLTSWLKDLEELNLPSWDKLPEIDLYMEQLTTYLDRITNVFSKNSLDKILTSSMINNYVKGQVIPSPVQKKYNKEHIAYIIALCSLKQVLPIQDIKNIFQNDQVPIEKKYSFFRKTLQEKANLKSKELLDLFENQKNPQIKQLNQLAFSLSIEAFINILISERILYMIELEKFEIEEKKRKKENKKQDQVE